MSAGSSLGAHCDEAGCHQLDFLPFTCDRCHGVFCLEHRDSSHHSCSVDITLQRQMPHCPVCQQVVFVSAGETADAVVNAHILSGCRAHLMSAVQQQVKRRQQTALRCDFADGCSNREAFATMQCKKCKLQFCLRSVRTANRGKSCQADCRAAAPPLLTEASAAAATVMTDSHRFPEQHKCASRQPQLHLSVRSALLPGLADRCFSLVSPVSVAASSSSASSGARHAKGRALLEKTRREREEKEAGKVAADGTGGAAASAVRKPAVQRRAQTTTLQQIRAQMANVGSIIADTLSGALAAPAAAPQSPPASSASSSAASSAFVAAASSSSPPPRAPTAAVRKQAVGDERISEEDRFYLLVDASAARRGSRASSPLPWVFVNRHWSVGRCLDAVTDALGLDNENHLDVRRKLCITCDRSLRGADVLPFDLPVSLLAPALVSGDTVQLRYKEFTPSPTVEAAAGAVT